MPSVLSLAAWLAVSLLQPNLPPPVTRSVMLLAQASGALSLFVIGGTLVDLPLPGLGLASLPVAIGKLVGHPIAILVGANSLTWLGMAPIDNALLKAGILMAAVPMLGINPILPQDYGLAEQTSATLLLTVTPS